MGAKAKGKPPRLDSVDLSLRLAHGDYAIAIDEMFKKTSTDHAPWDVIPANDKKYARVAALKAIVDCFGRNVDLSPPVLDDRVIAEVREHLDISAPLIDSLAGRTD
jgi:hypothetical protein